MGSRRGSTTTYGGKVGSLSLSRFQAGEVLVVTDFGWVAYGPSAVANRLRPVPVQSRADAQSAALAGSGLYFRIRLALFFSEM